ncbi:MAG: hypothetical protein Q4A82_06665 [Corynebacterium sp.]|nr:hypothetical protein [Corynebacterium sp.]
MTITEFITQLQEFATGAYLRPEEREYWEAPFDAAALPELETLLRDYAADVPVSGVDISDHVLGFYAQLREFNARHGDAVIEPEEEAEIVALVQDMWGAPVPDFADLDASISE